LLGGAAAALVALAATGAGVLRSAWFREQVRARIVLETERATGGQAKLDRFAFDWKTLTATALGVTLRGREEPTEEPLFQAAVIELKLSVLSWISRDVRLRSLVVEEPRVEIQVYPDGTTNLPQPRTARKPGNALEDLMRLKIGRIELRRGQFKLADRKTPIELRAGGLELNLAFDGANRRYRTEGRLAEVQVPGGHKLALELSGWLETKRMELERAVAREGESVATMAGVVNFSPFTVEATYEGKVRLADVPELGIGRGRAEVSGRLALGEGRYTSSGSVSARDVAFAAGGVKVDQASLRSAFELRQEDLQLKGLTISTPFGDGAGEARIRGWRTMEVRAKLSRVNLERVQRVMLENPYAWSGTANGPVTLTATLGGGKVTVEEVETAAEITPAEGAVPLGGTLRLAWDRASGGLRLDGTSLATREARLNVLGTPGHEMDVTLWTSSIRDVEPVVALLSRDETFALPVRLDNGEAEVRARVRGPLDGPQIAGRLRLRNAHVDEVRFDSLDTQFEVSAERLRLTGLTLKQQDATVSGSVSAELRDWRADWSSRVELSARVDHADVQRILGLFRVKSPVAGVLDGTLEARGPAGAPALKVRATGTGMKLGREVARKATFTLETQSNGDFEGQAALDSMVNRMHGHLRHAEGDFRNGAARITVLASNAKLVEFESVQGDGLRLEGVLSGEVTAEVSYSPAGLTWLGLDGVVTSPEIRVNDRYLEKVELRSASRAGIAELALRCGVRGQPDQIVDARARAPLNGARVVEGTLRFPRMSFAFLRGFARKAGQAGGEAQEPLPVRGFVEGEATYSVNLDRIEASKAQITVSRFQLRPRQNQLMETQIDSSELTLSNSSPVVIDVDSERATVRQSAFSAKETKLSLSGSIGLTEQAPMNLRLTGGANLAVLSTFRPEIEARGRAEIDASVRGTAADPSLSGRMTIAGASFFLQDLPNGIENANGTVFFEKNRANIEKLTGQTGGGEFLITGFIGLNEGEANYRLNAKGTAIRIRYPEGVSTTADASLDLAGTSSRSLLSGTVTILKSGFIGGGGDFGEVMGETSNPIPAPATRNEFLRNLQFDVKIRTAPDATLVSSYTEGLETEANLQLRGSPAKPVLLGSVEVNQGTIKFFGNRYTISRGELLFFNTAVVQPAVDLDLETRIRGVTVYINVSGPPTRLNVNYRSEPPLQPSEILALLTVGRAPAGAESNLQATSSIRNQNVLESASSNSLLGGALSAGISNRVERFFGASRIKIDPQATGVDNVAQARLSIEQSLSRDVTVTFVTNLSKTQEQIVRVEWDVSRRWQVIAVRDENGVFAVDFLFRTRFK
jgi:translocation and assembly module TamB